MWLDEVLRAQKSGRPLGAPSLCTAHAGVLRAAFGYAAARGLPLLVESTSNQVNQYGGYTGMKPADFVVYVQRMAEEAGFPRERLVLGGDHLGPHVWRRRPAEEAMQEAEALVAAYVRAGYRKIHLDCSMALGGDAAVVDPEVVAERTARLAAVAEAVHREVGGPAPRYVVGTEVPPPGGAQEHEETVPPTRPEDARQTLALMQAAFRRRGLEDAWSRVQALVVQPGVEFGDDFVHPYRPEKARDLAAVLREWPMVYEAHSTDYQTRDALRALVQDGFAILKVGPALTFAYREAVFALAAMEEYLVPPEARSHLVEVLEEVMLEDPRHWEAYYHGTPRQRAWKRRFSFSDRIRYYWPRPRVQAALRRLFENLRDVALPLPMLSQFMPRQYEAVRSGQVSAQAQDLVNHAVEGVLEDYFAAAAWLDREELRRGV